MYVLLVRERTPVNLTMCGEVAASCARAKLRGNPATTQVYDAIPRPSGLRATQFTLLVATRLEQRDQHRTEDESAHLVPVALVCQPSEGSALWPLG
jgi:hypothetical protein